MNVSAWSIRHPVPAILLFALLTMLGVMGFRALGIQNFPDIELPTVTIVANLEGADPTQLETEVARKIEDKVASLGGIEHMRTTITDGSASIRVEFQIDKDPEVALNEVRNAVDSVRADLPQDLTDPVVSKVTTTGSAIVTFTVGSDRMDEQELSWFVDNEISKSLLAIKGVGRVARVGGVDREVHVDLDSARMQALGVTAGDISAQLKRVQQDASGGRGDIGGAVQSVRSLGAVDTVEGIAGLDIPLADGRRVRLADLGQVSDSIAERGSYAFLGETPVVAFDVTRTKGASEVAVAQAVRAAVERLAAQYPAVHIAEAFNTVDPVEDNYRGSMELLFEGALLAILVVYLVPARLAGHPGGRGCPAALHHPDLRRYALAGVQPQRADPVGTRPGGGHPGRRCHRRDREHRPASAHGQDPLPRGHGGGGRDRARGHCDHIYPGGGLPADRLHGRGAG